MILSVCDNPDVLSVMRIVRIIITIIKIAVPIILIIAMMLEFAKAVSANDTDALDKAKKAAVSKVIAALLVFFIPTFVSILSNTILSNMEYSKCLNNATSSGVQTAYINMVDNLMTQAKADKSVNRVTEAYRYAYKIEDESLRQNYVDKLDKLKEELKK